jgi:hypothetical protein
VRGNDLKIIIRGFIHYQDLLVTHRFVHIKIFILIG